MRFLVMPWKMRKLRKLRFYLFHTSIHLEIVQTSTFCFPKTTHATTDRLHMHWVNFHFR